MPFDFTSSPDFGKIGDIVESFFAALTSLFNKIKELFGNLGNKGQQ